LKEASTYSLQNLNTIYGSSIAGNYPIGEG